MEVEGCSMWNAVLQSLIISSSPWNDGRPFVCLYCSREEIRLVSEKASFFLCCRHLLVSGEAWRGKRVRYFYFLELFPRKDGQFSLEPPSFHVMYLKWLFVSHAMFSQSYYRYWGLLRVKVLYGFWNSFCLI